MAPKGSYSKPPRYVHPRNNPERFRLQMEALREQTRSGVWDAQAGVGYRLNAHLGDLANPHEVTTTQINAWTLYPDNYTGNIDGILGNEMGSVTRQVWWTRIGSATGTFPPGVAPQQHDICVSHKTGNTRGWQEYYSHDGADIVGKYIRYSNANAVWSDWQNMLIDGLGDLRDVTITGPENQQSLIYDEANSQWINAEARHQLAEANPTGLINGAEVNVGPGANDVEVTAGLGVILDSYTTPDARPVRTFLQWNLINEPITAAPAVAGSYVFLTIANSGTPGTPINYTPVFVGELKQYATYPNPEVMRDEILLGAVTHNGTAWNDSSFPKVVNNAAESLYDIMNTVTGPLFVIDGGGITEASGYTLDQAAGTIWQFNRNWHDNHKQPHRESFPATTGIQWRYTNRDFSNVGPLTNVIDDSQWDNNGTVGPIPGSGNAATIQRLYMDLNDEFWMLWGQQVYDNAQEAASRLNAPIVIPPMLSTGFLNGYVVTEKGKNDWDEDEAFFIQGSASGTGSANVPVTIHNDMLQRDAADAHPITAIELMSNVAPTAVGDGIVWTGTEWEALNLWVAAGYGGIYQNTPVGLPNIGGGWTTLLANDGLLPTPRAVTQDFINNSVIFNIEGVWQVNITFTLTHNESNGGREFEVRLFNVTAGVGGNGTIIGVGRNQGVSNFTASLMVDIPTASVGNLYRVEVGNGDSLTTVSERSYSFSANLISEYRG